jgi:hypothetical protein
MKQAGLRAASEFNSMAVIRGELPSVPHTMLGEFKFLFYRYENLGDEYKMGIVAKGISSFVKEYGESLPEYFGMYLNLPAKYRNF